jgi:hypothetical protein
MPSCANSGTVMSAHLVPTKQGQDDAPEYSFDPFVNMCAAATRLYTIEVKKLRLLCAIG